MPLAGRIVKAKHAAVAFDGEGARLNGGRWNSPGTSMVYTADSPSLAALELLVGLNDASFLSGFVLVSIEIPANAVIPLDPGVLPANWQAYPAPAELAQLGDAWIKGATSLALRVPSAVVPQQFNFLINPQHAQFASLVFGAPEPFRFDERLLPRA